MNRLVRLISLVSLLALLLAACGASAAPTPAPGPTPTAIPGFKKLAGTGLELWLPDTFEGGQLSGDDLKLIVERLKTLGPEFEQTTKMLEANPDLYKLWAFDSRPGDTGFLTNVNVVSEKVLSVVDVETYLDAMVKQLPSQFKIQSRQLTTVNGQPAGQLISELTDFDAKQMIYILKRGSLIYAVTYTTSIGEFDRRRADFEQSIATFAEVP